MAVSLKFVSSPVAVKLQSYYSAASSGFATWAGKGDGTQPPGTGAVQSIELAAGAHNVVDVNACTWLARTLRRLPRRPPPDKLASVSSIP